MSLKQARGERTTSTSGEEAATIAEIAATIIAAIAGRDIRGGQRSAGVVGIPLSGEGTTTTTSSVVRTETIGPATWKETDATITTGTIIIIITLINTTRTETGAADSIT